MLERILSTDTFITAQGGLDGLSTRHAAISDNIANVNTPNYKRKEVPFEAALTDAVRSSISPCTGAVCGPVRQFTPPVTIDTGSNGRSDGNNVDIEREMVQLADNTQRYDTLVQYVTSFFSNMKLAINGGK